MEDTRKVHGMTLEKRRHDDGSEYYRGDHPFGGLVSFYSYSSTNAKQEKTEKWTWSYNGAHSSSHASLEDAVADWRDTCVN